MHSVNAHSEWSMCCTVVGRVRRHWTSRRGGEGGGGVSRRRLGSKCKISAGMYSIYIQIYNALMLMVNGVCVTLWWEVHQHWTSQCGREVCVCVCGGGGGVKEKTWVQIQDTVLEYVDIYIYAFNEKIEFCLWHLTELSSTHFLL